MDIVRVIQKIRPDAEWSLDGETLAGLSWTGNDKPTQAELDAGWVLVQADDASVEYKVLRAAEYPSMADQMDEIFHNGIDAWKAIIQAVKTKYPKP